MSYQPPMPRLPAGPLLHALEEAASRHRRGLSGALGIGRGDPAWKVWCRMRAEGTVTVRMADRLATRIGVHPAELWGQSWWNASCR